MTLRTSLVFLLAIASGISAIVGVSQMRSSQLAREMTKVVVVKKAIGRGYQIQEEDVETRTVPVDFAHKSMPRSMDEVVGRVATVAMHEGEYVMSSKITTTGAKAGLATLIPAGYRAYSITAVTAANRVSGLVNVGDRVDVLLTVASPSSHQGDTGVAETLLQNVEVMAIDRIVENTGSRPGSAPNDKNDSKPSTVTLLVTPKQANVLGLGQKKGALSLSLRNPEDQTIMDMDEITGAELTDYTDRSMPGRLVGTTEADAPAEEVSQNAKPSEEEADTVADSGQSLTVEEMQALLSDSLVSGKPSQRFTAIRTIRGSRVGIVPIRVKSE